MKAVGLYRYLPIAHPEALLDLEVPAPGSQVETRPRILRWAAAGVVHAVGKLVLEGF